VLLLSDAVGLDEQATPVLDVGQGVLGDGVALRVQEQKVFAEGFMYLRLSLSQCNVMGLPHLQGMVISKSSMLVWPLACSPQHPHSNS